MSKSIASDDDRTDLERMLEYFVDELGVTTILDLTKQQRYKLAYWVLIKNRLYMRVLRLMQRAITDYRINNNKN